MNSSVRCVELIIRSCRVSWLSDRRMQIISLRQCYVSAYSVGYSSWPAASHSPSPIIQLD